jgi:hypothetical protein
MSTRDELERALRKVVPRVTLDKAGLTALGAGLGGRVRKGLWQAVTARFTTKKK